MAVAAHLQTNKKQFKIKKRHIAAFFILAGHMPGATTTENFIKYKLDERKLSGTFRMLKPEKTLVDFCSNDYLGFARSAELKQNIFNEINSYPKSLNGSTGSRLLTGNITYAEELEAEIALLHQCEAGLLFNSGYDANLGLFSCLPQKGDTLILDELIHASVIDGVRLSYANRYAFKHNDLNNLEDKLKLAKGNCYVVIESVYSMDGDTPPVLEILDLTEQYGANLIVDEAHATGLYPTGLINYLNLQHRIFARIVTFGKALGCHGAIILGNKLLQEYLINFSRAFMYTTAASFHQLAAVKMAYHFLQNSPAPVSALKENISLFKKGILTNDNLPLLMSDSAIQCFILRSNGRAKDAALKLQTTGLDVRPILSPTVPKGTERIRVCLHSFNTSEEIELLTSTINNMINGC